ncbi:MAG: ferric reductase-like transmembrane domain-containing protein [Microthrixaceae bacterium]|nr:ferric reductase-like transmembrane domain-containing protein [Microthrixaceae bacterium]
MNERLWWQVARASGIVGWALLSATVIWGLLLSTKVLEGRPTPRWLLDLHRFLGGLATWFVLVHMVALVADSHTDFGPTDLLVPKVTGGEQWPITAGVVAFHLLVAVELSSLTMRRIPRRWWRWIHLGSFASFWLATLHGIAAGSSTSNVPLRIGYVVVAGVVLFLTLVRALTLGSRHRGGRRRQPARTVAASPPA